MTHYNTVQSNKHPGFALVIALSLMAMMVLLLVSMSSILQVEMSSTSHRESEETARMNAILGMQIALGQLQQYAGPDQRVTAPATAAYPNNDTSATLLTFHKNNAVNRLDFYTVLTVAGQEAFNEDIADWWLGDEDGTRSPYWTGVWNSALVDGVPDREQKPIWLVSQDGTLTPDSILPDPASDNDIVYLVDEGSAVDIDDSIDGYDGRVKAQKMPIANQDIINGHYAYWVGDESLKANFTLRDPFYDETDTNSREYRNRLQSPQRVGWENITGFDIVGAENGLSPNDPRLELLTSNDQIELLDESLIQPVKENFHSLTAYSQSLLTDPARGGLKKDLTVYFERGEGATNGGISDDNPIPNPDGDDALAYENDTRFGNNNTGFPTSDDNVPTWGQLKHWYDNEATGGNTGSVQAGGEFTPVVTYMRMFTGFSYENGKVFMHLLPTIVMWNPYDAGLDSATYEVKIKYPYEVIAFQVASNATGTAISDISFDNNTVAWNGYGFSNVNPVYYDADGVYFMKDKAFGTQNISPPENPGDPSPEPQYYIHEMTGLGGVTLNRKGGDFEQSIYSFDPWEDDCEITLTFNASFEPGQNLIFSMSDDAEVSKNSLRIEIPLANIFEDDQPASARFEIAKLDKMPTTETGMIFCNGYGGGKNYFDVTMSINGQTVFEAPRYGYAFTRSVGRNNMYGYDWVHYRVGNNQNTLQIQDKPDEYWKPLYGSNASGGEFRDMSGTITEDNIYGSWTREAPLIAIAEMFLEPFGTLQGNTNPNFYDGSGGGHDDYRYIDYYYRAMATHNLNAPVQHVHPIIDKNPNFSDSVNRQDLAGNNDDEFGVFHYGQGQAFYDRGGADSNDRAFKWDNNLKDGSGTDALGSSLITFYYPTQVNQKNAFAPYLPVRLVKRPESELVSLGQLQQVNLSKFYWQPAFPIGNSEASPYIDRELMAGIENRTVQTTRRGARVTVPNGPDNYSLDISYLLNDALWDRYFLSTIPQSGDLDLTNIEWPNSRHRPNAVDLEDSDLRDFDKAAAHLYNVGALNVNSTSVEAWKSLLTAFRDLKLKGGADPNNNGDPIPNPDDTVPIARSMEPLAEPIDFTFSAAETDPTTFGATANMRDYYPMLAGFRYLTDEMIDQLAKRIVDEVRLRGPFMSVSDFVNRRLDPPDRTTNAWLDSVTINNSTADEISHKTSDYDPMIGVSGLNGALQRALNLSGINGGVNYPAALSGVFPLDAAYGIWPSQPAWGKTDDHFNIDASLDYYVDMEHLAGVPAGEYGQIMSHLPGFVTQGDLLSMIGPALTARGDTFMIRSYGDSVNSLTGEVEAQAWLEAIVQRVVDPVIDADEDFEPDVSDPNRARRFKIIALRWLAEEDV